MSDSADLHAHATYVVRVSRDDSGRIRGVVQVATGSARPGAHRPRLRGSHQLRLPRAERSARGEQSRRPTVKAAVI